MWPAAEWRPRIIMGISYTASRRTAAIRKSIPICPSGRSPYRRAERSRLCWRIPHYLDLSLQLHGRNDRLSQNDHAEQRISFRARALSPDGSMLAVSYLTVDNGSAKSSVAFYNFSAVGQNYVDNFVSGSDYADAVIPFLAFLDNDISFAAADNRLVIYGGGQRPKSVADVLLNEEIQSVFYNSTHIGLVFLDTTGQGKYRLDVYDTSGQVEISLFFDMDYKDIILRGDNIVIYNETQCLLANMNGVKRFDGDFETPYLLFAPLSGNRYLAVSQDSIDTIEMK